MLKSWMGLCRKAIVGGAQFIGQSYVKAGQNTLYKMRWNPENPGKHQYATGVTWASVNAQNMKNFYDTIHESGKYFDVPTYKYILANSDTSYIKVSLFVSSM